VTRTRTAAACCAAIITALALGACSSSGVPSNAVATVGSYAVTKQAFNHWINVVYDYQYVESTAPRPPIPVPPNYAACIAHAAKVATGAAKPTPAELKASCAAEYKQMTAATMQFLLQGIWIQGEANDLGVHVDANEIRNGYNVQLEQEFPGGTVFRAFLIGSGETVKDLRYRVMLNLLEVALDAKVSRGARNVSAAAIKSYYEKNIAAYSVPERRNIELVLVGSAATAAQVKTLLASGQSYATVAKQYSTDPTTKDNGGVALGVEPNEETAAFSTAIFNAPIGVLQGPVKTAFGYYVFTVTKSSPEIKDKLKEVSPAIKQQIISTRSEKAVTDLQANTLHTWQARTTCAPGYKIATYCNNGPPAAATGASGAVATTGAT
jgi:foldase protein PrsA